MCCAPGGDSLPESLNKVRHCNREIVECLDTCSGLDVSCTRGIVGVPTDVVWAAMDLVEDWCCGERCPKHLAAKPATTGAPLSESSSKGATLEGLSVPIAREVA